MSILNKILLKIKSVNIVYIFLLTFLSFFIIFNFYWTKYRPMIATKDCAKVAIDNIKIRNTKFSGIEEYTKIYNFIFDRCMKVGYGIN